MFENPKNILEMKLNSVLKKEEESIISDLIKLSLLKTAEKNKDLLIFTEIYNLLGLDKFSELISLIDGREITFPSKENLKDTLITVLCYYYRTMENKDWDEVKNIVGDPDLNTIKYGIKAKQLESFIGETMQKALCKSPKKQ